MSYTRIRTGYVGANKWLKGEKNQDVASVVCSLSWGLCHSLYTVAQCVLVYVRHQQVQARLLSIAGQAGKRAIDIITEVVISAIVLGVQDHACFQSMTSEAYRPGS